MQTTSELQAGTVKASVTMGPGRIVIVPESGVARLEADGSVVIVDDSQPEDTVEVRLYLLKNAGTRRPRPGESEVRVIEGSPGHWVVVTCGLPQRWLACRSSRAACLDWADRVGLRVVTP